MTDLPDPLTPPDCDLRGMPYLPMEIVRLFDSELYILSTGEEFKAAFSLWAKSFLSVPAGSLPDDDRLLAHMSGAGANWHAVKRMAMHGFVLCSDGRWYHPVVCEKAVEAWRTRMAFTARTQAAREASIQAKKQRAEGGGGGQVKPKLPPKRSVVCHTLCHTVSHRLCYRLCRQKRTHKTRKTRSRILMKTSKFSAVLSLKKSPKLLINLTIVNPSVLHNTLQTV